MQRRDSIVVKVEDADPIVPPDDGPVTQRERPATVAREAQPDHGTARNREVPDEVTAKIEPVVPAPERLEEVHQIDTARTER